MEEERGLETNQPPARRRGRRVAWRAAAVVAAVLLAIELLALSHGSMQRAPAGSSREWAAACRGRAPRPDRILIEPCVLVRGRVVAVRGHGDDKHLAVIAGFHLLLVKLPPGFRSPGWGGSIAAVGALVRSRVGLREVDAWAVR